MRALFIYMRFPDIALRTVWEEHRMGDDDSAPYIRDCIPWKTLEHHATKGEWASRREEHWEEVEYRVLEELKSSTIRKEIEETLTLEQIMTDAIADLDNASVKSKEGLLGAIVRLDKHIMEKRDRAIGIAVAAGVDPVTGAPTSVTSRNPRAIQADDVDLSDDEIEELAILYTEKRAGLLEDQDGEE